MLRTTPTSGVSDRTSSSPYASQSAMVSPITVTVVAGGVSSLRGGGGLKDFDRRRRRPVERIVLIAAAGIAEQREREEAARRRRAARALAVIIVVRAEELRAGRQRQRDNGDRENDRKPPKHLPIPLCHKPLVQPITPGTAVNQAIRRSFPSF